MKRGRDPTPEESYLLHLADEILKRTRLGRDPWSFPRDDERIFPKELEGAIDPTKDDPVGFYSDEKVEIASGCYHVRIWEVTDDPAAPRRLVLARDYDGNVVVSENPDSLKSHLEKVLAQAKSVRALLKYLKKLRTICHGHRFKDDKIDLSILYEKVCSRFPLELSVNVNGTWVRSLVVRVSPWDRKSPYSEQVWFRPEVFLVKDHVKRLSKFESRDLAFGRVTNLYCTPRRPSMTVKQYREACRESARSILDRVRPQGR